MAGAGLVLILAGLVAPIALLALAIVFDLALLAWWVVHALVRRFPVLSTLAIPGRRHVHVHP